MKQSVLIASVLGGGIALGGLGVAGFNAMKKTDAPAVVAQASAPLAVASAPAAIASAPAALAPVATASAATAAPAPAQTATAVASAAPAPVHKPKPAHANYARILAVTPIHEATSSTKQVCRQEQVMQQAPVQDHNRVAGSVIGGVLGGVLGHQVGGGRGKDVATVVGALAGGLAGNKVQENMQQKDQVASTRTVCDDVPVSGDKVVGYTVKYSLDGKTGSVRMDEKPEGKTLPAKDGKLLI